MRRRLTILVTLVFLIASISISIGSAESEEIRILPTRDGEYWIYPGQTAIIRYGWATISQGLTQLYLDRIEQEFTLVGPNQYFLHVDSEASDAFWSAIEPYDLPIEWACPTIKNGSVVWWVYPLEELPAGDYTLSFIRVLDPAVHDPCDIDGDGLHDIYTGSEATVLIHVIPAE